MNEPENPGTQATPPRGTHTERLESKAPAAARPADERREEALKAITAAVRAAKVPGIDASQEQIAKAVLDGMGLIFGENPFVAKNSSMEGWGGKSR